MKDPIIAEIHHARQEHARRFNYDLHAICEDLRKIEAEFGDRVVSLAPRKLKKRHKSQIAAHKQNH
ncbi:MAG: hypothetical protein NTX50_29445 [Candidatus Sumerlaeota bacterium]|nr:hypothetical protein [Candidatus Sumerlaeota bacterium]